VSGAALAACVCLALPAVALAATQTFKGTTPQGSKCGRSFNSRCVILIHVSGGKVKPPSHVEWIAKCATGKALTGDTSMHGAVRGQKFHAHGTYTAKGLGTTSSGAPVSARETVTISFVIKGRKATGSLSAKSTVLAGSMVIDHCKTGKVHLSAKR
jgi:hypothetical protein